MKSTWMSLALVAALSSVGVGCGDDDGGGDDGTDQQAPEDNDRDGFSPADGDCDDNDDTRYPNAPEPCDGEDNDCDATTDEGFDVDGDFITVCAGDCADNDPFTYPGAPEIVDGLDNDCDGIPDNNNEQFDDDGDGYTEDQGDCDDDPAGDGDAISPGAIEIQENDMGEPEGVDNDCDGIVDEAPPPCPEGLPVTDPYAFVAALDLCERVTSAAWRDDILIDARSRGVFTDYGNTYVPVKGPDFMVLSTGIAGDETDPGYVLPQSGTAFDNVVPHPDPVIPSGGCAMPDEAEVNDYSELTIELDVPTNARSISFDFNFMSTEFPEYVCQQFDDTFLAFLESDSFTGNISFDAMGNRVSINVGFFTVCDPALGGTCTGDADLVGTGYDNNADTFTDGGGTGWLTTTAPITPGEKARLTFMMWDEGDHILDSAVIVDNFRWELEAVDGPVTVPRLVEPAVPLTDRELAR